MTGPGPDWVEQARRFVVSSGLADVLGSGWPAGATGRPEPGGPSADHPAECRWCPVCVGVAALRGRRPDLVEGLADVLSTAADVLRAHAAGDTGHATGGTGDAAGEAAGEAAHARGRTPPGEHRDPPARPPADGVREETRSPRPAPVQRIDVA
jgi:hypothetical protein